jgi:hypothetical protein
VNLDLDAWVRTARKAKTVAELDAAFAELGLLPTTEAPSDWGPPPSCDAPSIRKLLVDDFRAPLGKDGEQARVLQVLAALCHENWEVQRGVVLAPLGAGSHCRVETPFLNRSGSPWGSTLCSPAVFGFEKVTAPQRAAVKVTETSDWCGTSGSARGSSTDVSYWELHGAKLDELIRVTTASQFYNSPTPPLQGRAATLKFTGESFPKPLEIVETVSCYDPGDDARDEVREEFARCKASRVRKLCTYDGRAYTCTTK